MVSSSKVAQAGFQFPPPRGGEQTSDDREENERHFNSRPREGANLAQALVVARRNDFNSRPREGANAGGSPHGAGPSYFNSRPREGANYSGFP